MSTRCRADIHAPSRSLDRWLYLPVFQGFSEGLPRDSARAWPPAQSRAAGCPRVRTGFEKEAPDAPFPPRRQPAPAPSLAGPTGPATDAGIARRPRVRGRRDAAHRRCGRPHADGERRAGQRRDRPRQRLHRHRRRPDVHPQEHQDLGAPRGRLRGRRARGPAAEPGSAERSQLLPGAARLGRGSGPRSAHELRPAHRRRIVQRPGQELRRAERPRPLRRRRPAVPAPDVGELPHGGGRRSRLLRPRQPRRTVEHLRRPTWPATWCSTPSRG